MRSAGRTLFGADSAHRLPAAEVAAISGEPFGHSQSWFVPTRGHAYGSICIHGTLVGVISRTAQIGMICVRLRAPQVRWRHLLEEGRPGQCQSLACRTTCAGDVTDMSSTSAKTRNSFRRGPAATGTAVPLAARLYRPSRSGTGTGLAVQCA